MCKEHNFKVLNSYTSGNDFVKAHLYCTRCGTVKVVTADKEQV